MFLSPFLSRKYPAADMRSLKSLYLNASRRMLRVKIKDTGDVEYFQAK